MVRKIGKWVLPILASVIIAGCNTSEGKTSATGEDTSTPIYPVEVSEVKTGELIEQKKLSGTVMANKQLVVLPMLTGVVTKIHVANGDHVDQGDILIELNTSDVELNVAQAKAGLDAARANLEGAQKIREQSVKQAQIQLDQATELLAQIENISETDTPVENPQLNNLPPELQALLQSLISGNEPTEAEQKQAEIAVEQAHAALEQAKGTPQVTAAEASVKQAEIAVQLAEKQLKNGVVRAPISGQITNFNATVSGMVSPQTPLLQIVQMEQPIIHSTANEVMLPFLNTNQKVEINIKSLNKTYNGTISYISIMPGEKSRSYPVEIKIDDHDNDLRIGMLAEIIITVSDVKEQTLVPVETVISENNETVAYVTKDGESVERRVVTIDSETVSSYSITSGLTPGEVVVVRGAHQLSDGALINIRNKENPFDGAVNVSDEEKVPQ